MCEPHSPIIRVSRARLQQPLFALGQRQAGLLELALPAGQLQIAEVAGAVHASGHFKTGSGALDGQLAHLLDLAGCKSVVVSGFNLGRQPVDLVGHLQLGAFKLQVRQTLACRQHQQVQEIEGDIELKIGFGRRTIGKARRSPQGGIIQQTGFDHIGLCNCEGFVSGLKVGVVEQSDLGGGIQRKWALEPLGYGLGHLAICLGILIPEQTMVYPLASQLLNLAETGRPGNAGASGDCQRDP